MNAMLLGVAGMLLKDAIKQPYLKGRDYERNVRQAYRDVENLQITLQHVRAHCAPADLTTGPHAAFIRRAQGQLREAYRTLDRAYPRKAGLARLLEHASTPGAEAALLDIGKEACQTARGLGDVLAEIRCARAGNKAKEEGDKWFKGTTPIFHSSHPTTAYEGDMDLYGSGGEVGSDGFGSPHSLSSGDRDSLFDRPGLQPSSIYSAPSSAGGDNSCSPRGRHNRSHHHRSHGGSTSSSSSSHKKNNKAHAHSSANKTQQHLLQPPPPSSSSWPLDATRKSHSRRVRERERELALDNLQHGIDKTLRAQQAHSSSRSGRDGQEQQQTEKEEQQAMEYLEYALGEVLRLSSSSFSSSTESRGRQQDKAVPPSVDQDLCDAVGDLDGAMQALVAARSDRDKKRALRRVSRALEVLDAALAERKRYQEEAATGRRMRRKGGRPRSSSEAAWGPARIIHQ